MPRPVGSDAAEVVRRGGDTAATVGSDEEAGLGWDLEGDTAEEAWAREEIPSCWRSFWSLDLTKLRLCRASESLGSSSRAFS